MATYSTFFDHSGGLLKVMNTQLVRMVHIMIMLNTVERGQGEHTKSGLTSLRDKPTSHWASRALKQQPKRKQSTAEEKAT